MGVPIATNHLQIKIVAVKVIKCMVSGKKRGRKEREVTRERRKRRVGAIRFTMSSPNCRFRRAASLLEAIRFEEALA